jgi:hypothetical protein
MGLLFLRQYNSVICDIGGVTFLILLREGLIKRPVFLCRRVYIYLK